MKIIRNNFIPFPGYKSINLFGVLFVRKNATISEKLLNHERIHTEQIKEMFYVFFYLWYIVEWVIRLFMKGNAYRNISFEREAYANDDDFGYLSDIFSGVRAYRKPYAWFKYIRDNR